MAKSQAPGSWAGGAGGQTVNVTHPSLSRVQLKSISCDSEVAHECVCWLVAVVLEVVMKSLEPEPEGRALRQSWAGLPPGHLSGAPVIGWDLCHWMRSALTPGLAGLAFHFF